MSDAPKEISLEEKAGTIEFAINSQEGKKALANSMYFPLSEKLEENTNKIEKSNSKYYAIVRAHSLFPSYRKIIATADNKNELELYLNSGRKQAQSNIQIEDENITDKVLNWMTTESVIEISEEEFNNLDKRFYCECYCEDDCNCGYAHN